MNCKSGDLAVIVNSVVPTNVGGLVRVLDTILADAGDWRVEALSQLTSTDGRTVAPGDRHGYIEDACLRPIRPGSVTDEEVRELYAPKLPEVA